MNSCPRVEEGQCTLLTHHHVSLAKRPGLDWDSVYEDSVVLGRVLLQFPVTLGTFSVSHSQCQCLLLGTAWVSLAFSSILRPQGSSLHPKFPRYPQIIPSILSPGIFLPTLQEPGRLRGTQGAEAVLRGPGSQPMMGASPRLCHGLSPPSSWRWSSQPSPLHGPSHLLQEASTQQRHVPVIHSSGHHFHCRDAPVPHAVISIWAAGSPFSSW